jgi:hypothetical protein
MWELLSPFSDHLMRVDEIDEVIADIPATHRRRDWSLQQRAFVRTSKTNCDMKSVDLAYDRLHHAIRTARMCRARKGRAWLGSCSA